MLCNWRAECKRELSDDFEFFLFFFKSAWIFACGFALNRKTSPCIFSRWFALRFREITYAKKLSFPSGSHYWSFVEQKTKEILLCWIANRQSVYSVSDGVLAVFKSKENIKYVAGNLETDRLHRLLWHETQHVNQSSAKGNTSELKCDVLC